jgi:phage-related protein
MAKGINKKCQTYLNNKTRINNKIAKLERYIERHTKEASKVNILRSCRIGREKEGFKQESFKHKPKGEKK